MNENRCRTCGDLLDSLDQFAGCERCNRSSVSRRAPNASLARRDLERALLTAELERVGESSRWPVTGIEILKRLSVLEFEENGGPGEGGTIVFVEKDFIRALVSDAQEVVARHTTHGQGSRQNASQPGTHSRQGTEHGAPRCSVCGAELYPGQARASGE